MGSVPCHREVPCSQDGQGWSREGDAHGTAPSASGQPKCFSAAEHSPGHPWGAPSRAGHSQYLSSVGDVSLWGCSLALSWIWPTHLQGAKGTKWISVIQSRAGTVSPCRAGGSWQLALALVPAVLVPGREVSCGHHGARAQPGSIGLGRSCMGMARPCLGAGLARSVPLRTGGGWEAPFTLHSPGSQRSRALACSLLFKHRLYSQKAKPAF